MNLTPLTVNLHFREVPILEPRWQGCSMRRVLYILAMLNDEDIDWMVSVGRKVTVAAGDSIITEGQPLDAIFVVTSGRFAIVVGEEGNELESLTAGEMLGEISMLDSRPPTATVVARQPSTVLRIERTALEGRLASNTAFAARFYQALAIFLAQRLRKTIATFGYGQAKDIANELDAGDEIDPDLLDTVSLAGARFNQILERMSG